MVNVKETVGSDCNICGQFNITTNSIVQRRVSRANCVRHKSPRDLHPNCDMSETESTYFLIATAFRRFTCRISDASGFTPPCWGDCKSRSSSEANCASPS